MSLIFSESEISEENSANKIKHIKNPVPKLNIENIQPLDFSSLKSGGIGNKKSYRVDIKFNKMTLAPEEKRLITERFQEIHDTSDQNNASGPQFRRKTDLLSKRINLNFLSQREHVPFKLRKNDSARDIKNSGKVSNRYSDPASSNFMATLINPSGELSTKNTEAEERKERDLNEIYKNFEILGKETKKLPKK